MNLTAVAHAPDGSPVCARLLEQAFDACSQAISIVDVRQPAQPLVYVNHAFELLTGYARSEVLGRDCRFLQGGIIDTASEQRVLQAIAVGERVTLSLRHVRKDSSSFINELILEPIFDDGGLVSHLVGLQADVTERDYLRAASQAPELPRLGHDLALAGRATLEDRIEQSLARASAVGTRCVLLIIDLTPPPGTQDEDPALARGRLYEVSGLIGALLLEPGTSLLRYDEQRLALLLDPAPSMIEASEIARRLLDCISQRLSERHPGTTCHIGIAMGPSDGASARDLTLAARRALDRAKLRSPAGELSFFANAQDAQLLYQRQMEIDLAQAIASHQFTLAYQPIVQLDTTRIVGFEALIRWVHPSRGPVSPNEFIPVAEATGMIDRITQWVIEEALAQLAAFDQISSRPLRMFINITASELERPSFITTLAEQLARHKIKPGRVEFEITERTVTDTSPNTLKALYALRKLGVSLAVDDFGTGYSNLYNLTQLPIDALKVDRSLTEGVTHSNAAASVSRMICELGRTLEVNVVVEGIETEGQLNYFRAQSCPLGQGYLFSKPLPPDAACALLRGGQALFRAVEADHVPHLLLLDDEANILAALRRLLRHEGYHIHATSSPQEALEILATYPIGVVLSDQRMPQMNGTEFLRQVKKLHPNTVRIVLSGYSDLTAVTDAVNEGAIWRYLSKPWDDEALREQIRLAFEEHQNRSAAARQHASANHHGSRRDPGAERSDEPLALDRHGIAAAQRTLDMLPMLPIPMLGIDAQMSVVLSNIEADRQFGGGAALVGGSIATLFPPEVERALHSMVPLDLHLAGRPYRLHVQTLRNENDFEGQLLCFVPAGDD